VLHIASFLDYLENRKTKEKKRAEHTEVCVVQTPLTKFVRMIFCLLRSRHAQKDAWISYLYQFVLTWKFKCKMFGKLLLKRKMKCHENLFSSS
jgi:hypothetical protein